MLAFACTVSVARADVPKARIEGVDDEDLRERIVLAIGTSADAPASRFEARRRARDAADSAIKVLRSEGYYGYSVEPDVGEGERPEPLLRITPGIRFRFSDTAIAWQGEPPAGEARSAALAITGLPYGAPGRAEDVVEAEGRAVAILSSRGYADARATPREVIVDHATQTVQPTYKLAAGPLVRLDGIKLGETGRTDPEWIATLAPWKSGDVYQPEDVAELERRLLDTAVYDSITVSLAPPAETTAEGLRPVIVSLADRARHTLELGAGYSSSEGVGAEAEYARYNQFGRADTLTARLVAAQIERRLEGQLALPHFRRPGRTLRLGAEAFQDATDAYDETGVGVRADLEQRFGRYTYFIYGARADLSQTNELGVDRNFVALTGLGGFNLDRSNDPLDPITGYRLEGRFEPTALTGDASLVFLRATTQASAYLPFGEAAETVLAGRVRVGAIIGGSIPEVPAGRRFFAGGGGSVRGYEFQAIGPRLADDTPQGGLSLIEGSIELRRRSFAQRGVLAPLGAVAFIDAGTVGETELPGSDELKTAVGFGIRYDLGFAPVRADIAFPLQKRDGESPFQIYLSLGQAF